MSRTIFVALCAVAVLAMAPFAYSEGNIPPNPVTDAHHELAIGMTPEQWQPIAEKHLGWTKPEKSEYFAEMSTERRVMWTWDTRTKSGPNEPQWHFHLDVVFVEDVICSTMYFAEANGNTHEATETENARPAEPENPCLALWKDMTIGMTEKEFLAAAKKHGLGDIAVTKNLLGKDVWVYAWWKYDDDGHHRPPEGAWQWQVNLEVRLKDGCVSEVRRIPLCYRPEEKK